MTSPTYVPDGPPRAVAEYWHAAALERSDGGRNDGWTMVGHVCATILAAMDREQGDRGVELERLHARLADADAVLMRYATDNIPAVTDYTFDHGVQRGRRMAYLRAAALVRAVVQRDPARATDAA